MSITTLVHKGENYSNIVLTIKLWNCSTKLNIMKGGKKVAILAIYQYMYKVTKCILNRKSMKFAGESLKN